jgi:hypothetical protein
MVLRIYEHMLIIKAGDITEGEQIS